MFKIYHNPRCSKSRAGLAYMESKSIQFEMVDYIKNPLSVDELTLVFAKLNLKPSEMIRKHEEEYKTNFKDKNFTEEEWIRIFSQHPKLMNRPIVEGQYKAVWGNPIENIDELI